MKKVAFIIPVYRNASSLKELYSRLEAIVSNYSIPVEHEYIFVDDGSDDDSLQLLLQLKEQASNTKVIELSRNFGQVPAIVAGLEEMKGHDAVVIMSADMQDPVELIPKMIEAWRNNNEIVIAHRKSRQDSLFNRVSAFIFYNMMKLSDLRPPPGGFDFVLLDKKAVVSLKKIKGRNRFLQGDVLWLGFEVKLIPYSRQERENGKSQWKKTKKLKYLVDGLLSTSYWPIRLMSLIGGIVALTGFLYALIIVYVRIINKTPYTGWAPIMILILVLGGLIMIMLGLIGEYLWRIYDEVRGRPYYIVRKKHE